MLAKIFQRKIFDVSLLHIHTLIYVQTHTRTHTHTNTHRVNIIQKYKNIYQIFTTS